MEWQSDAREYLDGYLKQVAALAHAQGDDPEEIVQGLRAHVESELAEASSPISLDSVRRVVLALGAPEAVFESPPPAPEAASRSESIVPLPSLPPPMAQKPVRSKSCLFWSLTALVVLVVLFLLLPVLGILAAIAVPNLLRTQEVTLAKAIAQGIDAAEERYRAENNMDLDQDGVADYAPLEELVDASLLDPDFKDGVFNKYTFQLALYPSKESGKPGYTLTIWSVDKDEVRNNRVGYVQERKDGIVQFKKVHYTELPGFENERVDGVVEREQ